MSSTWQDRLADLIAGNHSDTGDPVDAGAQLVVTHPDGSEAFRAALARQYRHGDDGEPIVWIRPLVGGEELPDEDYIFHLAQARRRALAWVGAQVQDGAVVLQLSSGQVARVEPATGAELVELQRWDDFTSRLTGDQLAELIQLREDSWQGPFA